ncbi:MBL fold metallo-hydrolase [Aneurinibacillus terranovensis]|uniref:MBL fold metallo-hydrolase n=1 Tax=Aneurinibacillus terranovensis TaxID=278991 RepID=UPI0003FF8680|nr:MBL fold metallo-hydrolase [Aneurinibacillus terranovensis]
MATAINAKQLKELMDSEKGVLILDIRASSAYEKWHIEGKHAITMNLQHIKVKELGSAVIDLIPRDQTVVAVCEKGIVANQTASILENLGYDVVYLSGGMQEWSDFYETIAVYCNDSIQLYQIIRPAKGCLSYLIVSGNEAVVVDPSRHIGIYQDLATKLNVSIRHVIDTHLHADHISGGRALADVSGAEYWIPEEEMKGSLREYSSLKDRRIFCFGNGNLELISIKTPGHTISSMCLLLDGAFLLSGDTLFVNGIGRPDLKGRAEEMSGILFQTVTKILNPLKDELMILPGHFSRISEINGHGFIGESFAHIKHKTDLLNVQNKKEFICSILSRLGETPPNFDLITKINQGKYEANPNEQIELEIGPNLCSVESK